jgi:hypothetical protein
MHALMTRNVCASARVYLFAIEHRFLELANIIEPPSVRADADAYDALEREVDLVRCVVLLSFFLFVPPLFALRPPLYSLPHTRMYIRT